MEQGEICLARTLCILKRMAAGMLGGVVGLLMVAGGIVVVSILLPCRDFTVDLANISGRAVSLARLDVGSCDVWEGSLGPWEKKTFYASSIRCGAGVHLMTCDPADDLIFTMEGEAAGTYKVEVLPGGKSEAEFIVGRGCRSVHPNGNTMCRLSDGLTLVIDHLRCVWDFSRGVAGIRDSYDLTKGEGFLAGARGFGLPYPKQAKWCEDAMRKQDEERARKEEWRKSQIVLPLEYDEEKP